eukprot:TRINITY_DN18491_c0_g1_i15.p1 TRINITY_DN18491_c0_g1~~TRINITY_DN18491_c0_g1_i15.p1  ORF type:complete len:195 (-),score=54.69 TRINITY_DN18491_c0_g1_i15:212-796(-)
MIRRPPRSTLSSSSAASDVYKRQMGNLCRRAKDEAMVLIVGLDGSGKTTMMYQWKVGKPVATTPTVGFEYTTIQHGNYNFTVWDLGGEDKIRSLWRHHYSGIDAVVFVVDSTDTERMDEARNELWMMLRYEDLRDSRLLVVANKQDLPKAMSVAEVADALHLSKIEKRTWYIQGMSAVDGEGVYQGIDWISFAL